MIRCLMHMMLLTLIQIVAAHCFPAYLNILLNITTVFVAVFRTGRQYKVQHGFFHGVETM